MPLRLAASPGGPHRASSGRRSPSDTRQKGGRKEPPGSGTFAYPRHNRRGHPAVAAPPPAFGRDRRGHSEPREPPHASPRFPGCRSCSELRQPRPLSQASRGSGRMFWCASVRKRREVLSILGAGFVLLFFLCCCAEGFVFNQKLSPRPLAADTAVTYFSPVSRAQKAEPDLSEMSPAPLSDPFMSQGLHVWAV